jgi:hypothetical protein
MLAVRGTVRKKRVTVACRHCSTWFTLPPELAGSIAHCSHACLEAERDLRSRKERVSELVARNAAREAAERGRPVTRPSRHSSAPRESHESIPTFT